MKKIFAIFLLFFFNSALFAQESKIDRVISERVNIMGKIQEENLLVIEKISTSASYMNGLTVSAQHKNEILRLLKQLKTEANLSLDLMTQFAKENSYGNCLTAVANFSQQDMADYDVLLGDIVGAPQNEVMVHINRAMFQQALTPNFVQKVYTPCLMDEVTSS